MPADTRPGARWSAARAFLGPALLAAVSWGCSEESPERPAGEPGVDTAVAEPGPEAALHADPASHVFTAPVIVFATAGAAALEAARSEMGEEDFYVMADDLMWYRAMADDVLAGQDVPVERIEGRAGLRFLVDGEARHYGFPEIPTLDVIVLYRPGAEPVAVPPIELSADPELVARYFTEPVGPGAAPGGRGA